MEIKFSVVIPLYNKEGYVLETIKSVFNQTFSNYEVIIVNDASTDNSLEIVKSINDKRVRIIEHDKNRGLSATRNTGISNAKNEFIAFLDADDCWDIGFLEKIKELIIKNPKEHVFGTFYKEVINGKLFTPKVNVPNKKAGTSWVIDDFFALNKRNLIITQSCLVVKKIAFESIGGYAEGITFAEDIEFYIRCFNMFNLVYAFQPFHFQKKDVKFSITNSSVTEKEYPLLDKFLGKSDSSDSFINHNLYCFCRRFKNENEIKKMKFYRKKINKRKLTLLKLMLIYLPQTLYLALLKLKKIMLRFGLNPTSY